MYRPGSIDSAELFDVYEFSKTTTTYPGIR